MGYPMAINLRRKLDPNVTLLISDISPAAVTRFQDEASEYGPVEVVQNGFEAAEDAVSSFYISRTNKPSCSRSGMVAL